MWSAKGGVWSVECKGWSVECGVWSRQCDTSEVLPLSRKNEDRDFQNVAPATKTATHLVKRTQKFWPARQNDFRHVIKQVGMSQSAAA